MLYKRGRLKKGANMIDARKSKRSKRGKGRK